MIILIEGVDGSGKETQAKLLASRLGVEKISFPRYGTAGAKACESYLHGEVEMTPYGAAAAFAIDRAAWAKEWADSGKPSVIMDRYVFSNLAYQGAKFEDAQDAAAFVEWEKDFEYVKLELPKPNLMFYLVWGKAAWQNLLANRGGSKHNGADIHEQDLAYLSHVYDYGLNLAEREGGIIVRCDGMSREEIHELLFQKVEDYNRYWK